MREGWARLRHLMRKDWRYIRLWAAASAALTATIWPSLYWGRWQHFYSYFWMVELLVFALPCISLIRLLQVDPPLSSTSFWVTRPIDRVQQLASKLLVGFGGVIAPCLALVVVPLGLRRLDLLPLDYALALTSAALKYVAMVSFLLIVAAIAQRLSQVALLTAALVPFVVLVSELYAWLWPSSAVGGRTFWLVVFPFLLLAQALAFLGALYRTRRVARAAWTLAAGCVAILVLGRVWRWDLIGLSFSTKRPVATQEGRRDWPIRVVVDGRGWWRPGDRVANVAARVEGVPAGIAVFQQSYQVEGPTPSGWVEAPLGRLRSIPSFEEVALHCRGPRRDNEVYPELEIYRETGPGAPGAGPLPDRLKGRIRFAVVRPFVLQRAPVRGGTLKRRGRRTDGMLSASGGTSVVMLRTEILVNPPFARPDLNMGIMLPSFFDPASGDCLARAGKWLVSRSRTYFPVPLELSEEVSSEWRRMQDPKGVTQPLPPPATEMVFIEHEELGTFEVPFEVVVEPVRAIGSTHPPTSRDTLPAAGGGGCGKPLVFSGSGWACSPSRLVRRPEAHRVTWLSSRPT